MQFLKKFEKKINKEKRGEAKIRSKSHVYGDKFYMYTSHSGLLPDQLEIKSKRQNHTQELNFYHESLTNSMPSLNSALAMRQEASILYWS